MLADPGEISDREAEHRAWTILALRAAGAVAAGNALGASVTIVALKLGRRSQLPLVLDLIDRALKDADDVVSDDHPDLLLLRSCRAYALADGDRYDEAIAEYHALLLDQERLLEPGAPELFTTRNNLAVSLGEAGRGKEAIEQLTALLDEQLKALPADDRAILLTRHNLISWKTRAGEGGSSRARFAQAVVDYLSLIEVQRRVLGDDDPETLATRADYVASLALAEGERASEAIAAGTALLEDQQRILEPDDPTLMDTRNNLALAWEIAGDLDRAIIESRRVLEDRMRSQGRCDRNTHLARARLANRLEQAGRTPEAVDEYRALVADQADCLGADHPDTVATQQTLERLLAQPRRRGS
jgi:tetratricopeptide (TPR) repeat protein